MADETIQRDISDLIDDVLWQRRIYGKLVPQLMAASFQKDLEKLEHVTLPENHNKLPDLDKAFANLNLKDFPKPPDYEKLAELKKKMKKQARLMEILDAKRNCPISKATRDVPPK